MPTVPTLQGPQIQQSALPSMQVETNAPIEAFGGGEAISNVFDQATNIVQRAKNNADELAVMEAETQLSSAETSLMYDEKTGIHTRTGKDAFGLPAEISDKYQKESARIQATLSNDVQKRAFQQRAEGRYNDMNRQVQRHVFQQMKKYDDDTTSAYLKNKQDEAINNYQDPERLAAVINDQKVAIAKYGDRNGLPAEMIKMQSELAESDIHKSVINRIMSTGNDVLASKYFDANKQYLRGDDLVRVEEHVKESSYRGESQRQTDAIMGSGVPMSQALEKAKALQDPKLRDLTIDRVKQEYHLKDIAQREYQEKAQINAGNFIDKTKDLDAYIKQHPADWASFDISTKSKIEAYAADKKAGKNIVTDVATYYDLKTLATVPETKEKFLETNLMKYRDRLSDSDFKKMIDLQTGLRKGDGKAQKTLDGFMSNMQVVDSSLQAAGFNMKDKETLSKVKLSIDKQVADLEERTGKRATNKEIREITDGHMLEVVTDKGYIWDTKKKVYELAPSEVLNIDLKDIPQSERQKIQDTLKRNGLMDDDRSIIELYSKKLKSLSSSKS